MKRRRYKVQVSKRSASPVESVFVVHPPAPWSAAYRDRVRRALRLRAWTLGYADPDARAADLTRQEERGGHALTSHDFKAFGGA